jgi:Omp85 superfamily domain
LFVFPIVLRAQVKDVFHGRTASDSAARDTAVSSAGVRQIDITDVAQKIFKPRSVRKNKLDDSLVVKPTFSALPAVGYTLTTKTAGTLSGNMAFRTNPNAKLSIVTASAAYTQNKQFTVPVESNIWTKNSTYNFLGDYRFYKYPQTTFGLGSNSPIEDQELLDYYFIRFAEVVQHEIVPNFFAGLGYMMEVQWKIVDHPLSNGKRSDFEKYDSAAKELASGFIVNAVYDDRDNSISPSRGIYAGVQFRSNLTALGSQQNWQSLIIDTRTYLKFPADSRNVLAFWSYDWLIIEGKPPYLDLPSTTWDVYSNTGRGYIQGRFRGSKMVYLESEYRIALTANGLLGMVVFVNAESLSAAPGTPLESIQPGVGTGLRIKLNKKSKTNLAIDYGFGAQGSNGLFINIAEAF